jgi:hypothetical protein
MALCRSCTVPLDVAKSVTWSPTYFFGVLGTYLQVLVQGGDELWWVHSLGYYGDHHIRLTEQGIT